MTTSARTLGIIGAGKMGSALARLAVATGADVVMANSRAPETLSDLVDELGPAARAGTVTDVAAASWAIILALPMLEIQKLPVEALHGKVVIDVSNYFPIRDGRVKVLDDLMRTEAEMVASWLPGARYVKAFSNMFAHHLPQLARGARAEDRTAIPIASDDPVGARLASDVVRELGFDSVDGGRLDQAWRFEPEADAFTHIYLADANPSGEQILESALAPGAPVSAEELHKALMNATRVDVAARTF